MTKEQYEKLKEYIEVKARQIAEGAIGRDNSYEYLASSETEKELDKLMGFEE